MKAAALLLTLFVVGCAAPSGPPGPGLPPVPPPSVALQAPLPPPPQVAPPPGPRAGPSMRYSAVPRKYKYTQKCQIKKRKVPYVSSNGKTYYRTAKYKVC